MPTRPSGLNIEVLGNEAFVINYKKSSVRRRYLSVNLASVNLEKKITYLVEVVVLPLSGQQKD